MLNKKYILIFAVALAFNGYAQKSYPTNPDKKRANIWYFGQNAGINFNTTPPTALVDGKVNNTESCTSICDTAGNLLFYTDGRTVWNKNHDTLINGTGLLGDESSTQTAIVINHPSNDSIYYIVTTPYYIYYNNGCAYNVINIYKNAVIKKNVLLHPNSTEKITALKHANGRDIWVTGHEYGNDTFFSYLLTENGFVKCPVINKIGRKMENYRGNGQGDMKYSPNGKYLAITYYVDKYIDIYTCKLDDGKFKPYKTINTLIFPYSIDFSFNSLFLLYTQKNNELIRYNFKNNSITLIKSLSNGSWGGGGKTPHGYMLYGKTDSTKLDKIEIIDTTLNYNINYFNLNKKVLVNFPNFNQSIFYTPAIDFTFSLNCNNHKADFTGLDTFNANSYNWETRKLVNGNWQTLSNNQNFTYSFTDTGSYEVRYIAANGIRRDTITKTIILLPKIPKYFLGNDTTICKGNTINITKTINTPNVCITWENGSQSQSRTFTQKGLYYATITNNAYCQTKDSIYIKEIIPPLKPILIQKKDTLFSSINTADSFKWYVNGNRIYNNNKPFYKLNQLGNYYLNVSSNKCDSVSNTISVSVINTISNIIFSYLSIYPNPTSNNVLIQTKETINTVEIAEINGKTIVQFQINNNLANINLQDYSNGIYILKISNIHNQILYIKIIKQ